ncbi:hypothetical protein C4D60_Mb08t12250 [Musa balbisiana]|uniref:Wall-associated receptor kinase galacturonan-binding domain-containing protein n=1 Tax=Musa balbisiana TaxID=52838 RepID=A0A4S8K395_MUSBA|nr:hypothetical protein C4D60_Mb08t12250 [Musa balbisiana]
MTCSTGLSPLPLTPTGEAELSRSTVSLAFFVAILISDRIPAGQWRLLFTGCATRLGGRLWARQTCSTDSAGQILVHHRGLRHWQVACNGAGGAPPTTLIEFTLQGYGGKDFYDVSCVDGFNLPVLVVPSGGPNCNSTSCLVNVDVLCTQELRITAPDPRVNMINGKSTLGAVGSRV